MEEFSRLFQLKTILVFSGFLKTILKYNVDLITKYVFLSNWITEYIADVVLDVLMDYVQGDLTSSG